MCSSAAFTPMDAIIASLTLRKKASCSSTVSTPCKNHQPKPPQKKLNQTNLQKIQFPITKLISIFCPNRKYLAAIVFLKILAARKFSKHCLNFFSLLHIG